MKGKRTSGLTGLQSISFGLAQVGSQSFPQGFGSEFTTHNGAFSAAYAPENSMEFTNKTLFAIKRRLNLKG